MGTCASNTDMTLAHKTSQLCIDENLGVVCLVTGDMAIYKQQTLYDNDLKLFK